MWFAWQVVNGGCLSSSRLCGELHLHMHWNPFSPKSLELYWLDLIRKLLQVPHSWNLFKCSPFLKEHIPTLIYFKTAFRRCHSCDEVLGLCCQCAIKNWISDIEKSHSSQVSQFDSSACHITAQYYGSISSVRGGKKKDEKGEKAKSAVSFFIIELEIDRNMYVNPEMT